MRSLSDTLARLAKLNMFYQEPGNPRESRLKTLSDFGSNPGALTAKIHIPKYSGENAPLVVVLHGCTQNADSYDAGSGWSKLGDDYGFAVLFPEQTRSNNGNTCFNWFQPGDIRHDQGEMLSIRQMIETVCKTNKIDRRRIYVTGLSAGGAMANALLANYPEIFAGGAIIAGLPFGVAATVPEAFDRMRGHGLPETGQLQGLLRTASTHKGPWPTISVWHGTRDSTVAPANSDAIVAQWLGVHGMDERQSHQEEVDGHRKKIWRNSSGEDLIEQYAVEGMAHGTPLDVSSGYGENGPFMLEAGISSTVHIARSWGLAPSFERRKESATVQTDKPSTAPKADDGIRNVIEDALRAAGLMR